MKNDHLKPALILTFLAFEISVLVTAAWAVANPHPVPSPFPSGWRLPFYNDGRARITAGPGQGYHTGDSAEAIDFVAADTWATTLDVRATAAGTARAVINHPCAGWTVGIEHSNLNASVYEHLASGSILVSPGQSVSRGQVIADWDNSGSCTTGGHLHFEAKYNVNWGDPTGSGSPVSVRDLRGIGWYPWWPNTSRDSGLVVQSTSHTFGVCTSDITIDVRWLAKGYSQRFDERAGNFIDGYSWQWSTSSTTIPDNIKDAEETTSSTTSPALTTGTWWFHFKVRSTEGQWTRDAEVVHLGGFCIQAPPPTTPLRIK